mgnify:CR=1 FL=1
MVSGGVSAFVAGSFFMTFGAGSGLSPPRNLNAAKPPPISSTASNANSRPLLLPSLLSSLLASIALLVLLVGPVDGAAINAAASVAGIRGRSTLGAVRSGSLLALTAAAPGRSRFSVVCSALLVMARW